ncbi:MAG: HupE/UreJ family protein [Bacteroidota bacterium]|nr:HupE/UreJ family protein [Candidatus Kapabacteria bacterium]MDW8219889.1 HupE/UreJ family protein [Bacteroidota bacterium]
MQTEFVAYLQLGFLHISDLQAYDHILFITALCALYDARQWKHLLWLVTAFTVGHSITLALSTLNILVIPSTVVELLIPLTIIATSIVNIVTLHSNPTGIQHIHAYNTRVQEWLKYGMALTFGFIHGMGFSSFLKSLLGKEASITLPLFAFNCGLECGQVLIVGVLLACTFITTRILGLAHRDWSLVLSGSALGVAITLVLKQIVGT